VVLRRFLLGIRRAHNTATVPPSLVTTSLQVPSLLTAKNPTSPKVSESPCALTIGLTLSSSLTCEIRAVHLLLLLGHDRYVHPRSYHQEKPWSKKVRTGVRTAPHDFFSLTLSTSLCAKPLAVARLITYPVISTWLPPFGYTLLILAFSIFSFVLTFGNRVYSRPPNFGSWPIGLRPAWIAVAMLPWM
jgi:hypothetical protein